MLLTCFKYLKYNNREHRICETLFDSAHIKWPPTGQTIAKRILVILEKSETSVANRRVQPYDGAKVMSCKILGAAAFS